ncbi:MAG: hypothetical protein COT89_00260 [Candidatus Colwellbacteria bacterium CG10_big_fil_rev_8_21_14_0_10_42_22]|uniref:Abortive phage infection protein C-terminal domain-containing protein n=1 Tax=Candidatus Colwellbacteria bacterium CG10_big_fil_rev_8_21_14_0_10_42_22 TaxID=1974540 RepID=A0A2H0VGC8_9BACT|nr:MAG: hypothetical protein COT89_00260 [Candidatus Colwellbacteria bacterium CG10_big_fil_rev_8_21_14_0_10_42_22]
MTQLIKLPVVSFRKIASPYDDVGARTYVAVVNVKDVPEELEDWRKALNPRDPKITSGVAKKIFATLENTPETFFFRNRGITLIANKTRFDNQRNVLEVEMENESKNGLLDGGHTFRVIREFVDGLSNEELGSFSAYVRLEIIEGVTDPDEVVNIVESRNTSTQVKEQSLEELRGAYDAIKGVLESKPYAGQIAYKEFELTEEGSVKNIDIKEILSYLVCFDVEEFSSDNHPIRAYTTRASVVEHFKRHKERVMKYIPLLPTILELRDLIYLELPKSYNKQGGKFGRLTGVTEVTGRKMSKADLPFLGKESSYRIPNGFIYPVLAAFRNLIKCDSKKCEWKTDPIKMFDELKDDLASRVGEQALEFRNPNKLGKDKATWRACYDSVELALLKRNI